MWERLSELNAEFKDIKKAKKEAKNVNILYFIKPCKYMLKLHKVIIKNV